MPLKVFLNRSPQKWNRRSLDCGVRTIQRRRVAHRTEVESHAREHHSSINQAISEGTALIFAPTIVYAAEHTEFANC